MAKLKSSRLSYKNVVVSLPLESILSKISKHEADEVDSVIYVLNPSECIFSLLHFFSN